MTVRRKDPMPLDILRGKVTKAVNDILALKAAAVDMQSRMAKVETALGTIGKGEMPPNVERQDTRDGTRSDGE